MTISAKSKSGLLKQAKQYETLCATLRRTGMALSENDPQRIVLFKRAACAALNARTIRAEARQS